jgi:hypothetical protein
MVFNATFNNISVIVAVSFIDGANGSTWGKPPKKTTTTEKALA